MTEIDTIEDQSLSRTHLDRLIIFSPNSIFNPKTIITPDLCQRHPDIHSSIFNPEVLVTMKYAASQSAIVEPERRRALICSNFTDDLPQDIRYKSSIELLDFFERLS